MTADSREPGSQGHTSADLRAPNIRELGVLETGVEDGVHRAIFEGNAIVESSEGASYLTNFSGGLLDIGDMVPQEVQRQIDRRGVITSPTMGAKIRITVDVELIPLSSLGAKQTPTSEL